MLRDDTFGVDEALNETAYGDGLIVSGKHWLVFGKKSTQSPTLESQERFLQNRLHLSNWLFFDDASSLTVDTWSSNYKLDVS